MRTHPRIFHRRAPPLAAAASSLPLSLDPSSSGGAAFSWPLPSTPAGSFFFLRRGLLLVPPWLTSSSSSLLGESVLATTTPVGPGSAWLRHPRLLSRARPRWWLQSCGISLERGHWSGWWLRPPRCLAVWQRPHRAMFPTHGHCCTHSTIGREKN